MKQALWIASSLLVGLACGPARADFVVSGSVVEGRNFSEGIYNVLVEVVKGDEVVAHGRTTEKGIFRFTVPRELPFTGVLSYKKVGYKEYPTKMPLQATRQTTIASSILLVPDGASDEYMTQLTDQLVKYKSGGNLQQISALIPSIVGLPPTRKALVFEQLLGKDKDLYASLQQANAAQSAAVQYQSELRKKDPQALVWPYFATGMANKVLVYGVGNNSIEVRNAVKPF
jgi:hypothetical protein